MLIGMGLEKEKLVPLVQAAQSGDSNALNALFNVYYNDVYYFALKTVKDSELACDITQETFVEIFTTISQLKEPAAFVTWSKQITYHQCTRYFKKKKDVLIEENEDGTSLFDTLEEDNADFIPDEALDKEDFRKTILAMIDQLSEEQRSAVMMYYFDELSVSQIAQIQGVSEGTVKSRLNYARKSIKSSVEDYEKKHHIKLHSFAAAPLLLWLFRSDKLGNLMSPSSLRLLVDRLSKTTGKSLRTAVSTTSAATPAVETAKGLSKAAAKKSAKVAAKKTAKEAAKAAGKSGLSFGAKFGFFILSIGGVVLVGGAALVAAVVLTGGTVADLLGDNIGGYVSDLVGGVLDTVSSKAPEESKESSAVLYEVDVPQSLQHYTSDILLPFSDTDRLGNNLKGVYSNPYYAVDQKGNLYRTDHCSAPLVSSDLMVERYCFDNVFVYLDPTGNYNVIDRGDYRCSFSKINGKPVGVYFATDHANGDPLLNVLSLGDDKRLYISAFTLDGSAVGRLNVLLEFNLLYYDRVFETVDYVSCSALHDGLQIYMISDGIGLYGQIDGDYRSSNGTYEDSVLSMRFVEYVFAGPFKFVDIGTADNRALHLDRRTDKIYLFYKWYALPDGYDADSVKELLVVSSNPVVLFDDGSVWNLRKDGMWYQSITLSKLGKEGKLLHIFKMTDPDCSDDSKTYDKLYVMLDDYRLYRVSMGKDMLVNYFSVYDEVR